MCLWKVFKHDYSESSVIEVCNCTCDKYMKLRIECMTGIKQPGTHLIVIPSKTFSISLCSIPVHWDTNEIPFLKWCRPGYPFIALNCLSSSFLPIICMHHWMRWSLKMPLWSWWRRSDVKQLKMLQWGRLAQKGLYAACKPCFLNWGGSHPCWCFVKIYSVSVLSQKGDSRGLPRSFGLTVQCRHLFSMQHLTRHCSGKSAMYAASITYTSWTHPSAQTISTPSAPALIRELLWFFYLLFPTHFPCILFACSYIMLIISC